MNKGFRSLTDRVIESLLEISPFAATSAGAHQYDHLLDRHDPEARTARRAQLRDALRELKAFENAQLTHSEEIDLRVLAGALQVMIRADEDQKPEERNPDLYVSSLLEALFTMVARDYAPVEERARALLERLRGVPNYVDVAARNLKQGYDLPRVWTEVAIETLEGADLFFRESLAPFARKSGKLAEELEDAVEGTRRLLVKFRTFLRDDLLPRCDGSFAVGRDFFEFLLEKSHGLSLKAKDLILFGEEAIQATRAEMERVAAEIAPKKRLEDVLADLKKHHPAPDKILQAYRKEVDRARDFVVKKDLVTIPADERLSVIETPTFERAVIPYAAYMPPAPFEHKQEGFFFVTPVDRQGSAEKQRDQLEGHCNAAIPITVVHEAYPGHHLQLCHANRASSKVRRLVATPVFAEGWALYCEELMFEEGFYQDPRLRLEQLKELLLRACRVVIDVKLQLQQLSIDEAVDMLVNTAGLERTNAVAEVKRYALTPTQPLCYLVGKREILRIRDEFRQQKGEKFRLKEFHDKLLSLGTIPLSLVRDAMLK
jgi:uncharacterized protein (DUF885 family)